MVADKCARSQPTSIEKTHRRAAKGKFVNIYAVQPWITGCQTDRYRGQAPSHTGRVHNSRFVNALKVGGGLPPMAALQALHDFQPNLVLIEQLHQRRHRLLIGDQAVHQADRPEADHGIAPEFARVRRQDHLAGIGDDRL